MIFVTTSIFISNFIDILRGTIFMICIIYLLYLLDMFPIFMISYFNYRIIHLHSINICWDIFVFYEFSNFFWNMLNSKAIKSITVKPFRYETH